MVSLKTLNEFENRLVEYPNRYRDQNNNQLILARDEGTIINEGTPIDDETFNPIIKSIEDLSTFHSVSGTGSNYIIEIENWETTVGSCLGILFSFGNEELATIQFGSTSDIIFDLVDKDGNRITGDDVFNTKAFVIAEPIGNTYQYAIFSAGASGNEAGEVLPKNFIGSYAGTELPTGYAWCDGQDGRPLSIFNGVVDVESGEETFLGYKTDGKWVYAKKVSLGALPNSVNVSIPHGIDFTQNKYIGSKGYAYDTTNGVNIPIPYTLSYQTTIESAGFQIDGANINFYTNRNMSNYTESYIIIEYTKNNDTFEPQYNIIKTTSAPVNIINGARLGQVLPLLSATPHHGFKIIDGAYWLKTDYQNFWDKYVSLEVETGNPMFQESEDGLSFLVDLGGGVLRNVDPTSDSYNTLGQKAGEDKHTLVENELPNIQGTLPHTAYGENKLTGVFSINTGGNSSYEGSADTSSPQTQNRYLMSFGANEPHNNLETGTATYFEICVDASPYTEDLDLLDDEVLEIKEKINGIVKWENPSPTNTFPASNISILADTNDIDDLSNYKYYEIEFFERNNLNTYMYSTGKLLIGINTRLSFPNAWVNARNVTVPNTGTVISFSGGNEFPTYGGSTSSNDGLSIPYRVILYKA